MVKYEELSWVRVLVISVPVAQELRNIVEWYQDKSNLIPRGDYRRKGHRHE
jgi:hypothetical protein